MVNLSEAVRNISDHFGLSESERSELLPSGVRTRIASNVQWAATYLVQAGLLTRPKRNHVRITESGRAVLQTPPPRITVRYLDRYPPFREFLNRKRPPKTVTLSDNSDGPTAAPSDASLNPEEQIESAYRELRSSLVDELLELVKQISPGSFESLVVRVLRAMGYGGIGDDAAQAIGRSGDDGIDGVIKEDLLGLDFVGIQAKRWSGTVGSEVIRNFAGSLQLHRTNKGVLITTSTFTQAAIDTARNMSPSKIVLVDGRQLAEYMLEFGIGVTDQTVYHVKRIDRDFFEAAEI